MPFHEAIETSLSIARDQSLKLLRPEYCWQGELELNAAPTAQFVMTCFLMSDGERWLTEARARGAARYLSRSLNADGSLSAYAGQAGHRSFTLDAAVALELIDRRFGLENELQKGALERANQFLTQCAKQHPVQPLFRSTEFFLGMLGILDWKRIPKIPLELLLAPRNSGLEKTAYWIRTVLVPMALLGSHSERRMAHGRKKTLSDLEGTFQDALAPEKNSSWATQLFRRISGVSSELPRAKILRDFAENRIDSFTESNGDIAGNPYAAFFSALYWDRLENPNHWQRVKKQRAMDAVLHYAVDDGHEWRLQTNLSTIWDTGFFLAAFPPEDKTTDPRVSSAAQWLEAQQILDKRGDWAEQVQADPAGFSFGKGHDHYPVTDCTALSVLALHQIRGDTYLKTSGALAAARFLLAFQAENGGFAPYEKPQLRSPELWNRLIPFQDIPTELFDRSKCDVTGKVCEALALFRSTELSKNVDEALARARAFLLENRDSDGLWTGNYGVNRLYGTTFSVKGLRAIDSGVSSEWADPAVRFFVSLQNSDGGWGETESSERCPSSPVQTAWAILGLAACWDDAKFKAEDSHPAWKAMERGCQYLILHQKGLWNEPRHLGMVFRGTVNFRYEYYPAYFPMLALQAVQKILNKQPSNQVF